MRVVTCVVATQQHLWKVTYDVSEFDFNQQHLFKFVFDKKSLMVRLLVNNTEVAASNKTSRGETTTSVLPVSANQYLSMLHSFVPGHSTLNGQIEKLRIWKHVEAEPETRGKILVRFFSYVKLFYSFWWRPKVKFGEKYLSHFIEGCYEIWCVLHVTGTFYDDRNLTLYYIIRVSVWLCVYVCNTRFLFYKKVSHPSSTILS